ncbi:unnamed protein product [Ambrosiozyma monospora]|uniref:Unnamed protein product n=1 Tax=Ambrosiozyma monospora TaxID=43982 RepID=A0ACB5UBR6_AMBMO|nr:unnamed protein product [Ambrosiozyma monospora]
MWTAQVIITISQSIDANNARISVEYLRDVTSNHIPGQSKDNTVTDTSVPGMSQTKNSNVAETPLSVPMENKPYNVSEVSSVRDVAGMNSDAIITPNFIHGQSKDYPVQDSAVPGMSQTSNSNVVEIPLSILTGDSPSDESVSSSDRGGTSVNADTVGMEFSLVNTFMNTVSSIISRHSGSGVDVRKTDSQSTGGSPEDWV